jgi:hypothetical protein
MSAASPPQPDDPHALARSDVFYSGAIGRIKRLIWILGLLFVPLVWFRFGALAAAGFVLGGALSYLNFYWLAGAAHGLADRIVDTQSSEKGGVVVARFLLRYLAIGVVVYVTFIGWFGAFYGLLMGLCLPVAGLLGEAACELYVAFRRGL